MKKYIASFFIGFAIAMIAFVMIFNYTKGKYDKQDRAINFAPTSNYNTYLFDDGTPILTSKYYNVKLGEIPSKLITILLWSEDRDFFHHPGFNMKAFFRSIFVNLQNKGFSQGGSTLTQQLVRNTFTYLSQEKSISRKILEIMTAFFVERSYTKEEILEAYINTAFQGGNMYGFGASSLGYYNKTLNQAGYPEILTLVGINNAANLYSPYKYPDRAQRQAKKLFNSIYDNQTDFKEFHKSLISDIRNFLSQGKSIDSGASLTNYLNVEFDESQYYSVVRDDIYSQIDNLKASYTPYDSPWFYLIEQAKAEAKEFGLNLENGNYTIRTTFNRNILNSFASEESSSELLINNKTGAILAFWGTPYSVFLSQKQIGSTIKPFYYAMAIEKGMPITQVLPDSEEVYKDLGDWKPKNHPPVFQGSVTLEQALINSINIPSIYLAIHLEDSIPKSVDKLKKFLTEEIGWKENAVAKYPNDLTLTLGTVETSPYAVARAFTIFPNYGLMPELFSISEVVDAKGNVIYRRFPKIEKKVTSLSAKTYAIMNQLLAEVITSGTARAANINGIKLGGKTGSAHKAAWFTGFNGSELFCIRKDGEGEILSSEVAVPIGRLIEQIIVLHGENATVKQKNVVSLQGNMLKSSEPDLFADPISFISAGYDPITYLDTNKSKFSSAEFKSKVDSIVLALKDYPDISNGINNWLNNYLSTQNITYNNNDSNTEPSTNTVVQPQNDNNPVNDEKPKPQSDFLSAPQEFVNNGGDVEQYLGNLNLNQDIVNKLRNISSQIEQSMPEVSSIINNFLAGKGF